MSFSLLAVLAAAGPAAAGAYRVTDLSPGFALLTPRAPLNNQGQVVGMMTLPSGNQQPDRNFGFLYDPTSGGRVTLFGVTSPGGQSSGSLDWQGRASAINDAGQVVGANNQTGQLFVYDSRSGQTTNLPADGQGWGAAAITSSGQVLKTYTPPDGSMPGTHPTVYQNGAYTSLGLPPGTQAGSAIAMNDAGQVLISAFTSLGATPSTYLLSGGQWSNLGSFWGTALNARGDVAGYIHLPSTDHAGILSPGGGSPVDLGTLPGYSTSLAFGINARGDVVGSVDGNLGSHGFLYQDGVLKDLNALIGEGTGWTIRGGRAINDRGQILAVGVNATGEHVLLLTPDGLPAPPDPVMPALPVPEPGPIAAFGAIAAWLGWRRAAGTNREARRRR